MSLEALYEAEGLPAFDLPDELVERYGGALGFDEPRLYANFVASADGVVAIPGLPQSNKLIAGESDSDRFVMGLLRACADAVVIGSGTLNGSPRGLWSAEHVYPAAAEAFAELRRRLGRHPAAELAVLTTSGCVDPMHPALEAGALVVTTDPGAARLAGRLPEASTVISLGAEGPVDPRAAVELLHERGHRLILSESGPHVFGSMVAAGLVDELFLTVSPLLAGRADDDRLGLVEGVELLPDAGVDARLLGVRRDEGHLFLRYALG